MKLPVFSAIERKINNDEYAGFCIKCGQWTSDCCEPDISHGECPKCETNNLYGAEQCLIEGLFIYSKPKKD